MKVYLAAPVVTDDKTKKLIEEVHHRLKYMPEVEVYRPGEHQVPNAWGINIKTWGQCVFTMDVVAIDNSDWIVLCNFGRNALTTGTAWECGYAFAKGKKILIVDMPNVIESSLMITGCAANRVKFEKFTMSYRDDVFFERGKKQQKEILN